MFAAFYPTPSMLHLALSQFHAFLYSLIVATYFCVRAYALFNLQCYLYACVFMGDQLVLDKQLLYSSSAPPEQSDFSTFNIA